MYNLQILQNDIKNCKRCPLSRLLPGGSHPIPYDGPSGANIVFIGESPGSEEAELNKPFVGRSGRLLNSILKNAGVNREDVGILNIGKCYTWQWNDENDKKYRKNRTITQVEIDSCKGWLREEIDLIKPSLVFTLGKIPLRTILEMGSNGVLKFNSQFQLKNYLYKTMGSLPLWPTIKVVPLYHPSYLLTYGSKKDIELTENVIKGAVDLLLYKLNKEKNANQNTNYKFL